MNNVSCHRVVSCSRHSEQHNTKHHCDEAAEKAIEWPDNGQVIAANTTQSCPMNCCDQGTLKSGTALVSHFFLPVPVISEVSLHFSSVVFLRAGFSSHTDRGPPLS
jgi:hypothetical protein